MNVHALKDLRDYHQAIIDRLRKTICVRDSKACKRSSKSHAVFVAESERFKLRDHERFVSALDEVLANPTKP